MGHGLGSGRRRKLRGKPGNHGGGLHGVRQVGTKNMVLGVVHSRGVIEGLIEALVDPRILCGVESK